jgi:hypothetical protein
MLQALAARVVLAPDTFGLSLDVSRKVVTTGRQSPASIDMESPNAIICLSATCCWTLG